MTEDKDEEEEKLDDGWTASLTKLQSTCCSFLLPLPLHSMPVSPPKTMAPPLLQQFSPLGAGMITTSPVKHWTPSGRVQAWATRVPHKRRQQTNGLLVRFIVLAVMGGK